MIAKRNIVGLVLLMIGAYFLIVSIPQLIMLKGVELSNNFLLGAFTATLLQFIISIVLLYFASKYLRGM